MPIKVFSGAVETPISTNSLVDAHHSSLSLLPRTVLESKTLIFTTSLAQMPNMIREVQSTV